MSSRTVWSTLRSPGELGLHGGNPREGKWGQGAGWGWGWGWEISSGCVHKARKQQPVMKNWLSSLLLWKGYLRLMVMLFPQNTQGNFLYPDYEMVVARFQ